MREAIVAANWKMNKTVAESAEFARNLSKKILNLTGVKLILCPPFTSLFPVWEILKNTEVGVGAQNMFFEESGAYTGEISSAMLLSAGCCYVILGHSERRHVFHEPDELIKKKIDVALQAGLQPIICVGEKIDERKADLTAKVIRKQYQSAFADTAAEDARQCIIAYEPVWAIGTGLTASPQQASEAHALIRELLADQYDRQLADAMPILYGGSVKPANAQELITTEGIDGFLIGGASLVEDKFVSIAEIVEKNLEK